jgi:putative heme transporter
MASSDAVEAASWRSAWQAVPFALRTVTLWSACVLIVGTAVYMLVRVAVRLAPLTLAVVGAALLAGLLVPLTTRLARWGVPRGLAALASVLVLLVAVLGPAVLVSMLVADQFTGLRESLTEGFEEVRAWLTRSGSPISSEQFDSVSEQARAGLGNVLPSPAAGAALAAETFGAILTSLIVLFFFLKDGPTMWSWFLQRLAERHRPRAGEAGQAGWTALTRYVRGTVAVATIDAVGIGAALVLIGVPLALPLAVLTFLAAFVPIVGATVAGAVAVLVALAANGPVAALLTLAAVVAVQQIEGNLLEPLIMGRQLRLHPIVVLLAVFAGTLLGGIAGAVVAVPVTAVSYRVIRVLTAKAEPSAPEARPEQADSRPSADGLHRTAGQTKVPPPTIPDYPAGSGTRAGYSEHG